MSEVAMNTCSSGLRANFRASQARSISPGVCGKVRRSGAPDLLGDAPDRLKVPGGAAGKPRLDDVHVQAFELTGQTDFFIQVHAGPGRLFPVAQCGVEDADFFHRLKTSFRTAAKTPAERICPKKIPKAENIFPSARALFLQTSIIRLFPPAAKAWACGGGASGPG